MPNQTAPGIRKQYLHLSLYRCENCKGPLIAAAVGTRESEISRESELKPLGSACLSCGNRQPAQSDNVRHFPPVQWETPESIAALAALRSEDDRRQRVAGVAPSIP